MSDKSFNTVFKVFRRGVVIALLSGSFLTSQTAGVSPAFANNSSGANAGASSVGPSGLPLPRFASLKAERVNMRVGPGRDYQVEWMFTKQGLPLEILQEFDNWRKVRDSEGEEGWILQSLLSGKRTALVAPWKRGESDNLINLHQAPDSNASLAARLEPGVLISVNRCDNGWCQMEVGKTSGYARQAELWGVYPDEDIK